MKIQEGSVFLTDDFIQTISSNKDAKLSGYTLLKLPKWGVKGGMQISAGDLGLPIGITDPNALLPEVFKRYWLNLAAHARQYHSTLEHGNLDEDFAEQSFWKCMARIMPKELIQTGQIVVYKADDLIVNSSNVDGNIHLEALISVHAGAKTQQINMNISKPAYLQAIGNLPINEQVTVIGGRELALYDEGKVTYDLTDDNCLKAEVAKNTEDTTLEWNAVLLHYSIGNLEQVAGLYFPDKFKQVDDHYELPTIRKSKAVSRGYSINLRFTQGSQWEYKAENADASLAMQIYTNMYRRLLQMNLQYEDMVERMLDMQSKVTGLQSMFKSGYFAGIENRMSRLEQAVASKLRGSVSPDKLLELFLEVRAAKNTLNLEMNISDMTQAMTSKDIKVSNAIGSSIRPGDIIPAGTDITTLLTALLTDRVAPEYTGPSIELLAKGAKILRVPIGSTEKVPLTGNLVQHDAGVFSNRVLEFIENGIMSSQAIETNSLSMFFEPTKPITNRVDITYLANFADGPLKYYSDGTPCYLGKVYAGVIRESVAIVPVYDVAITSINIMEQLMNIDITALPWLSSDTLDTEYSTEKDIQVLIVPANVQVPLFTWHSMHTYDRDGVQYNAYAVKGHTMKLDLTSIS